jgi:hypothetical protein
MPDEGLTMARRGRISSVGLKKRPVVSSRSEPAYDWRRANAEASARYKAEQDAREREKKEAAARKLAVHMAKSPRTREMEAQLLGEKIGASSTSMASEEDMDVCVKRLCLASQRESLRRVKDKLMRWDPERDGGLGPVDAMERRAFMRGAWWSIKENLEPVCRPVPVGDERIRYPLDGLRRCSRKGRR